jgi:short-subunit dehydrogenase
VNVEGARTLITGATGGLGHAIARSVAAAGGVPVLTGRRTAVLDALAAEVGGTAIGADLSAPDAVNELATRAGRIDVAVVNAALPATGDLASFAPAEIERALRVNLGAPILLARALVPAMAERGRGHVVLVSSIAGKVPTPNASLYTATKFGLRGFGLALRQEMRAAGVGISVVSPGFIAEAGMFAETGVRPPRGIGTVKPGDVAAAVLRAIRRDLAEVDVAPFSARFGARLALLAPGLVATMQRRVGADRLLAELAVKQRDKR